MTDTRVNPNFRLEDQGITGVGQAHYNLLEPALMTQAVARGEGKLGLGGAFLVSTGAKTGRSPKDKFVVRTAGHVLDPSVLGSIEFGTEVLRAPLVVVLAHKSCGAINATLAAEETGDMPPGYLHTIIERVMPSILHGRKHGLTTGEQFEAEHARATSELLPQRSQLIRDRIDAGRLAEGAPADLVLFDPNVPYVEPLARFLRRR